MDYDNLIFLHIPKAAGSTLHPVLERHYSTRTRHTIQPGRTDDFKCLTADEYSRIRLLKGYMPFGMHEYQITLGAPAWECCMRLGSQSAGIHSMLPSASMTWVFLCA